MHVFVFECNKPSPSGSHAVSPGSACKQERREGEEGNKLGRLPLAKKSPPSSGVESRVADDEQLLSSANAILSVVGSEDILFAQIDCPSWWYLNPEPSAFKAEALPPTPASYGPS